MARKKKKKPSSRKKGAPEAVKKRGGGKKQVEAAPGKIADVPQGGTGWPDYMAYAVIAALLLGAFPFIIRSYYVVSYPFTINYSEDALLVSALELAAGRNLYAPYQYGEIPYVLSPYPPVFYSVVAAFSFITGPSLQPGRFISLFSSLGIAAFIFMIIRRETRQLNAAVIGGITYITLYPVYLWGALHRVDNLMIFLAVGGLYFGTIPKAKRLQLAAAMALLLGSIFTKQSSVAALVVVLYGLWFENRKRALWFGGLFVAIWGIIFGIMALLSDGGYVYTTVTSLSTNPISWDRFASLSKLFFKNPKNIFMVALAVIAVAAGWIKLNKWVLFAGLCFAQGMLTIGKFGSGPNYFMEFDASLAVMAGMAVAGLLAGARREGGTAWIVVSMLFMAAMVVGHIRTTPFIKGQFVRIGHLKTIDKSFKADELVEKFSKPGDVVLTKWVDMAVLMDRIPVMNDPFTFGFLAKIGKWDETAVLKLVQNGAFPFIIGDLKGKALAKSEFYSETLKSEILKSYTYVACPNGVCFFLPNSKVRKK